MMDDLRYPFFLSFFFLSFFFTMVVVVGLARDGCLVRSWGWGHAVGLAVERKRAAQQGCTRFGKANPVPPLQAVGGSLAMK